MCSTRKRLAALLREQRLSKDLSLRQVSEAAKLAPSTLSRWEAGACLPRVPELDAVLKALSVRTEDRQRILASLDAPRAARALRDQRPEHEAFFAAPSGGALIRALRSRARLSLNEISEAIGVSASTVSRWECGAAHPSPEQFEIFVGCVGASEEARQCLTASGVAKLKVVRPEYSESQFAAQLKRLEVESPSRELDLLKLQTMLWWFRDEPGATRLLQKSLVVYATLLLQESRFKEAIQQAESSLSLSDGKDADLVVRAYRVVARADVFRSHPPRPHRGLYTLESCLSLPVSRNEQKALLADMAELSSLANRHEDAAEYRRQLESLRAAAVTVRPTQISPSVKSVVAEMVAQHSRSATPQRVAVGE